MEASKEGQPKDQTVTVLKPTMEVCAHTPQPKDQTMTGWQLGKNLGACMKELYERNLWTDVKFRCKDHEEGERIYTHKVILAARSPVFQEMFYGAHVEHKEEVELPDIEKNIFDLFLRYVYTDTVALEQATVPEVLRVAQVYEVPSLVQICVEFLEATISTKNACRVLNLAFLYKSSRLRDACCSYIDQNAEDVLNSDGFIGLTEETLLHILKGDTFYANEDEILKKTEEWAIKKVEESGLAGNGAIIRKTLGESFYYIRLPTMTYTMLMKCTRNKGYFSAEEYLNMADFINGIPDTKVLSNSSVARLPMTETLVLNSENGEEKSQPSSVCSFDITVSQDTELVSFGVCRIEPYVKFFTFYYTERKSKGQRSKTLDTEKTSLEEFMRDHRDQVIKVYPYKQTATIIELDEVYGNDLDDGLHLIVEGSLSSFSLGWKENFVLDTLQNENGHIDLKQPVILRKSDKPYYFNLDLKVKCKSFCYSTSNIYMKMRCSNIRESVQSKTGHVKVSTNYSCIGIKSLVFRNLANRDDDVKETGEANALVENK